MEDNNMFFPKMKKKSETKEGGALRTVLLYFIFIHIASVCISLAYIGFTEMLA
jgi:hypothetical protein